jgi:hypothetical protein
MTAVMETKTQTAFRRGRSSEASRLLTCSPLVTLAWKERPDRWLRAGYTSDAARIFAGTAGAVRRVLPPGLELVPRRRYFRSSTVAGSHRRHFS